MTWPHREVTTEHLLIDIEAFPKGIEKVPASIGVIGTEIEIEKEIGTGREIPLTLMVSDFVISFLVRLPYGHFQ